MKASDIFNIIVQSGLLGVLLGLVISGIKCAKAYIDAKSAEATANIKDSNIKSALNTVENCITTVVLELSQTVVDDLKASSADGKLTPDEIAKIKSDAVSKVEALLSTDVSSTLNQVFGDAQAYISSKIEAEVKKLKLAANKAA